MLYILRLITLLSTTTVITQIIITIVTVIDINIIMIGITWYALWYLVCVGTVGLQGWYVGWLVIESLMHAVCDCDCVVLL